MADLLALVVVGFLLLVLGAIVRFSIVSQIRTRGARGRLRRPDPEGVETVCGFAPPPELVQLYLHAPFIERVEFQLVDRDPRPPRSWSIGAFVPLTPTDVREARIVTGVSDGIPIADDLAKGTYVVVRGGAVLLRSRELPGGEASVASSARELQAFEARDD